MEDELIYQHNLRDFSLANANGSLRFQTAQLRYTIGTNMYLGV